MGIHIEVDAGLPFLGPWALDDAHALARVLHAEGHYVSVSGLSPPDPGHGAVAPTAAGCDVAVCVGAPPSTKIACERLCYWMAEGRPPPGDGWSAVVANADVGATTRSPGPERIAVAVIPPPLGPLLERRPRDRFVTCAGPSPGLLNLLEAWPGLWERHQLPLSIACDLRARLAPPGAAEWRRRLAPLLNQPGIVVHPQLAAAPMRALLARARAMLWPMDGADQPACDVHRATWEALAQGTPVVTTCSGPMDGLDQHVTRAVGGAGSAWCDAADEAVRGAADRRADWSALMLARNEAPWAAQWSALLTGDLPLATRDRCGTSPRAGEADMPRYWRPPPLVP